MSDFDLLLFGVYPALVQAATGAGVDGIVVDWENAGKRLRQAGADTEVNHHTAADLSRVRAATDRLVICRIESVPRGGLEHVEAAIALGADELLVPMARRREELEAVIDAASGRCGVGMLIETAEAAAAPEQFAGLKLRRVYVGLNDLAIERRSRGIFDALVDGTVDRARRAVDVPFGVAGLTLPEAGHPVPCRLLIAEMARLRCGFGFLRRSFLRDVPRHRMGHAVPRIKAAVAAAAAAPQPSLEGRHQALRAMLDTPGVKVAT